MAIEHLQQSKNKKSIFYNRKKKKDKKFKLVSLYTIWLCCFEMLLIDRERQQ